MHWKMFQWILFLLISLHFKGGPSGRSGYYGDGHSSQYNYKHCQPITEEGFCVVFEDVAVRQAFIRKVGPALW